ncbi:MAG TPA: hypothetical protein VF449_06620 [Parvibaculum sp.]
MEQALAPDGAEDGSVSTDLAGFSALWATARSEGSPAVLTGDPAGRLAAFLDGSLDADERMRLESELVQRPAELHELLSAGSFVDAVDARLEAPPAELLATALAGLTTRRGGGSGVGLQSLVGGLRAISGNWRLAGGVLATAMLAAVIVTGEMGDRTSVPFAAKPEAPAVSVAAQPVGLPAAAQAFEAETASKMSGASGEAATKPVEFAAKTPCDQGQSASDGEALRTAGSAAVTAQSGKSADAVSPCHTQQMAEPAYGSQFGTTPAAADSAAAAMPAPADAAAAPAENMPSSTYDSAEPAGPPPRE